MRARHRLGISVVRHLAACLVLQAAAPAHAKVFTQEPPAGGRSTYHVDRATSPIRVDGVLDEPAWADATSMELEYEVQPGDNIAPPVRTVLLTAYDDQKIYFAFRCYDPDPSKIRARYSDRDKAWSDDWVGVVLDTFNDQRRAYELFTNPLGVQIDALNDDLNGNYDDSWNAIWDSAGRVTDEGYEVEMAIPFNQIRFEAVEGQEQIWGFDANRSYPRSDRHHIGLFARERGNNSYLAQASKLVGVKDVTPGKNLEILPTLTAARTDTRDLLPGGPLERGGTDSELGLTVRWGITPNVSLNAAANPDFSQVEADVLQLDINEPFTLFYPETRPFFKEGADYFDTPLGLVHTRNVADPDGALKLTGKEGRHTFAVFSAEDQTTSVLFPGPEGSFAGQFQQASNATVGRYRYDFGGSSSVGGTVTSRSGEGYYNRVASAESKLRFTDSDQLTLNFAASETRYNEPIADFAGAGTDDFRGDAMFVQYQHTVRNWWVELDHFDFDDRFRADLGFRPSVGLRDTWVGGARVWWGDEGTAFNRMAWGGGVGKRERQDGALLRDKVETWWNINLPRQTYLAVNAASQDQGFNGREFPGQMFYLGYAETQLTKNVYFNVEYAWGDGIDFDHTRPAKRRSLTPVMKFNLGRHLLLQYRHIYSKLDVAGGELFHANAPEARVIYQFTARAYVRAILQYANIARNQDLYASTVDRRSRDLFSQLLFTYKVNPQTAFYAGYTDSYAGTEEFSLTRTGRTLFVKLGYAWLR